MSVETLNNLDIDTELDDTAIETGEVEQLTEALQALEGYRGLLAQSPDGQISRTSAQALYIGLEHINNGCKLDLCLQDLGLESYVITGRSGLQSVTVSSEAIGEGIKKVVDKIIEKLKELWAKLMVKVEKLMQGFPVFESVVDNFIAHGKKLKGEPKYAEIDGGKSARRLVLKGQSVINQVTPAEIEAYEKIAGAVHHVHRKGFKPLAEMIRRGADASEMKELADSLVNKGTFDDDLDLPMGCTLVFKGHVPRIHNPYGGGEGQSDTVEVPSPHEIMMGLESIRKFFKDDISNDKLFLTLRAIRTETDAALKQMGVSTKGIADEGTVARVVSDFVTNAVGGLQVTDSLNVLLFIQTHRLKVFKSYLGAYGIDL